MEACGQCFCPGLVISSDRDSEGKPDSFRVSVTSLKLPAETAETLSVAHAHSEVLACSASARAHSVEEGEVRKEGELEEEEEEQRGVDKREDSRSTDRHHGLGGIITVLHQAEWGPSSAEGRAKHNAEETPLSRQSLAKSSSCGALPVCLTDSYRSASSLPPSALRTSSSYSSLPSASQLSVSSLSSVASLRAFCFSPLYQALVLGQSQSLPHTVSLSALPTPHPLSADTQPLLPSLPSEHGTPPPGQKTSRPNTPITRPGSAQSQGRTANQGLGSGTALAGQISCIKPIGSRALLDWRELGISVSEGRMPSDPWATKPRRQTDRPSSSSQTMWRR